MPRDIPTWMSNLPQSFKASANSDLLLDVEFPLDVITPVIGGGAESLGNDDTTRSDHQKVVRRAERSWAVDPVRVPSIRGQLRFWWRAAQLPVSTASAASGIGTMPSPEALFMNEARTWGGVSLGDKVKASGVDAWPSRVVVSVEVLDPGRVVSAGVHEAGQRGAKAFPRWAVPSLGYALFPLQWPGEVLRSSNGPLPTKPWREGVRFKLRVQLLPLAETDKTRRAATERYGLAYNEESERQQLLAALWSFIHVGGLGARTRRGFGAFGIRGEPTFLTPVDEELRKIFVPPSGRSNVTSWLQNAWKTLHLHWRTVQGEGLPEWPLLHAATLGVGPGLTTARDAHGFLIDALREMRQGPGVGRNPGSQPGRPGRSRWPEADWLKRVTDGSRRWHHPPAPVREGAGAVAPRAAFGMPIQIQFKDEGDKAAGATIVPTPDGGRWASPMILRPLLCGDGKFVPFVVAFDRRPGRGPLRNLTVYAKQNPSYPMASVGSDGAATPIREYLGKRDVDAVEAFMNYLKDRKQGFEIA